MTEHRANKADPFDVWGAPPKALTRKMTPRQLAMLRRYTEAVVDKCYRIAFDCGFNDGLCRVSTVAAKEMRKQRDRMARSR